MNNISFGELTQEELDAFKSEITKNRKDPKPDNDADAGMTISFDDFEMDEIPESLKKTLMGGNDEHQI